MKAFKYILGIIILLVLIVWWSSQRAVSSDLVTIVIAGQSHRALLADEPVEWQRGLSGQSKPSLMLFIFPDKKVRTFWMKDMRYSIDIIWLAGERVVGVERDLPWPAGGQDENLPRFSSPRAVDRVLEIPVDLRQDLGLNIESGDKIEIKI